MKLIARSEWTAIIPRPSLQDGPLPYFREPPAQVEFCTPNKDLLYVHRNPALELIRILKDQTNRTALADIDYNYAIAQNVEGAFVLRGAATRCSDTDNLRVLMLIGKNEKPTDLLKQNQLNIKLPPVGKNRLPHPVLRLEESNIHVFDLIEWLVEHNYYKARNDGVYGALVDYAVKQLQADLGFTTVNGVYDEWTHRALIRPEREYIKIA